MWQFEEKDLDPTSIPEDAVGFIYLITNLEDGKLYVGKKNLFRNKISVKTVVTKTGPNKGTKRKKKTKIKVDSDWQSYWGSNEELKELVAERGEEKFKKEILRFCKSKSEMSYYETREQFVRDVLLDENYYNQWISVRVTKAHMMRGAKFEDEEEE